MDLRITCRRRESSIQFSNPAVSVANKSVENPLRIWIYEQISVTGHSDAHLDAHSDHVFLKDNRFLGYIFGKTEVKLKIMAHGFCA